uniref:Uncharacterized protein n=1 Tax=Arundo donax TaxID=35708 RepID=A0A0A8YF83_ARUDO
MSGMFNAHSNVSLATPWSMLINATRNSKGKPVDITVKSTCSLKLGVYFSLDHVAS